MFGLVQAAARGFDRRVEIETGGVQHITLPRSNVQARVLVLQFRVLADDELPVPVTEAGVPVGQLIRLLTVLAVAIGVNVALFTVYRLSKELPPTAVEDAAAALRNFSALVPVAVIAAGLIWGLPWLQRKGHI